MALNPIISIEVAKAMLDALNTALGSGATLRIYKDGGGGIPTHVNDAEVSGDLLATCEGSGSMFAAATATGDTATEATMDLDGTLTEASGDTVSGTAAYFRLYELGGGASGTCHFQGTCGTTSSFDLVMPTTTITAGVEVNVTALTITQPTGQ